MFQNSIIDDAPLFEIFFTRVETENLSISLKLLLTVPVEGKRVPVKFMGLLLFLISLSSSN